MSHLQSTPEKTLNYDKLTSASLLCVEFTMVLWAKKTNNTQNNQVQLFHQKKPRFTFFQDSFNFTKHNTAQSAAHFSGMGEFTFKSSVLAERQG